MFEYSPSESEDICAIVIGIGSVGCKIVHKINESPDQYTEGQVTKLYLHTSRDVLSQYSDDSSDSILLNSHIHFFESEIKQKILGANIVFLVAGLGGETGSLVPQHVARIAKELNVLCVGLFSFPFEFEGRSKKLKSQQAYLSLSEHIDSLVCIENDRFLEANLKSKSLHRIDDLFQDSNRHFNALIKGLLELVTRPGLVNVDFIDAKTIFSGMGLSTVGYSKQIGEDRAENAVRTLFESPAMQNYDLSQAKGMLINITAGLDISIEEFETVGNYVKSFLSEHATVVVGTVIDPEATDTMEVTAIITGLPELPIDKTIKSVDFDFIKLSKSITFDAHQASAGLSILSYFNEFLHQKYSGIEAKVSIEQTDYKVCLIVETSSGDIEKVEKSLHEFGLVVVGQKKPSEVLKSSLDIEKLQMKLEMAAMELKHSENFLRLYKSENEDYKSRVISLENQMHDLQRTICQGLTNSQASLSLQLSNSNNLPLSLIKLLERNLIENIPDSSRQQIEEEIRRSITDTDKSLSLKQLANNAIYGVAGNSLYSLIISILNTLPK